MNTGECSIDSIKRKTNTKIHKMTEVAPPLDGAGVGLHDDENEVPVVFGPAPKAAEPAPKTAEPAPKAATAASKPVSLHVTHE